MYIRVTVIMIKPCLHTPYSFTNNCHRQNVNVLFSRDSKRRALKLGRKVLNDSVNPEVKHSLVLQNKHQGAVVSNQTPQKADHGQIIQYSVLQGISNNVICNQVSSIQYPNVGPLVP